MFYGALFIGLVMGTMLGVIIMSLFVVGKISDLRAENEQLKVEISKLVDGDTYSACYWGPGE